MYAHRGLLIGLTAASLALPVSIGMPSAAGTSDNGGPTLVDLVPSGDRALPERRHRPSRRVTCSTEAA